MKKRERVLKALNLEEADMCPINYLGFEQTGTAYQQFINSEDLDNYVMILDNVGDITQQRFFNVDCWTMSPFPGVYNSPNIPVPPDHKGATLSYTGKFHRTSKNEKTGMAYGWYDGPYFKSVEIIEDTWKQFGKPSSLINQTQHFDRQKWYQYVHALEDYLFPMPGLAIAMHEAIFEGCGAGALAKFFRKSPKIVHDMMSEYTKVNLHAVKLLLEAGVDVMFYYDDLGQRDRSILSLPQFKEFILPYYKQIYDAVHKGGAYIIQHSCGYVDEFLPYMVDAGLDCIQALEPAAGVNLGALKEKLGDKLAFMGGMDSTRTLNFGTPKDVEEDVKKCIKAAGIGGGYIAGPSHNIMDVPWENLMVLRAALEKYRKYPIKF
jgi:hypothetical protein